MRTCLCRIIALNSVLTGSSVSEVTDFGLNNKDLILVMVRSLFFLLSTRPDRVWGPTSLCLMDTGCYFPGRKSTGASSWPLTFLRTKSRMCWALPTHSAPFELTSSLMVQSNSMLKRWWFALTQTQIITGIPVENLSVSSF